MPNDTPTPQDVEAAFEQFVNDFEPPLSGTERDIAGQAWRNAVRWQASQFQPAAREEGGADGRAEAVNIVLTRWLDDQHPYMTLEVRQLVEEVANAAGVDPWKRQAESRLSAKPDMG